MIIEYIADIYTEDNEEHIQQIMVTHNIDDVVSIRGHLLYRDIDQFTPIAYCFKPGSISFETVKDTYRYSWFRILDITPENRHEKKIIKRMKQYKKSLEDKSAFITNPPQTLIDVMQIHHTSLAKKDIKQRDVI